VEKILRLQTGDFMESNSPTKVDKKETGETVFLTEAESQKKKKKKKKEKKKEKAHTKNLE